MTIQRPATTRLPNKIPAKIQLRVRSVSIVSRFPTAAVEDGGVDGRRPRRRNPSQSDLLLRLPDGDSKEEVVGGAGAGISPAGKIAEGGAVWRRRRKLRRRN